MAIDYKTVLAYQAGDLEYRYTDRDAMLYALGTGFGRDPLDKKELPFVYEKQLRVSPSFASVATPGMFKIWDLGIDFKKVLHGEYSVEFARPLPPEAGLLVDVTVAGVWDKGADKGALLSMQADVRDRKNGERLYTIRSGYFCRGDGGFLKPGETEINEAPKPHALPERPADFTDESITRVDQPLLYRLCSDRNPLHADPDVAVKAGFDRPILHGLCTYGICCRAILKTLCDYDPARIRRLDIRFSQPVFPGETIVVDMWKDGNVVSFRAKVKERDIVVANNGRCDLVG